MLERLEQIEARYEELANELSAPETWSEQAASDPAWSGMAEDVAPNWSESQRVEAPEPSWSEAEGNGAEPAHRSFEDTNDESGDAIDEASQQLREFLGMPESRDEEYQAGHPWGA